MTKTSLGETCAGLDSPKTSRPPETIEEQVTRNAQAQILDAYAKLAKLAALPKEVRELPVNALHDISFYF